MDFNLTGFLRPRGPERRNLVLGFMPTLDAAVLLVARARGFFEDEGLDVRLVRQTSWHLARDRLAAGELDAAHLPATMPLVAQLGMDGPAAELRTAFVLALGGSALGVTPKLADALARSATSNHPAAQGFALKQLIRERREAGQARLRFAVTDRYSIGSYDLRYWLAACEIDPASDLDLVPVTPSRVVASLARGTYDGGWLDEPYGSMAADRGLIQLQFSKHQFWNHSLGKVLAVRDMFLSRYPRSHRALLRALLRAAHWLEGNRGDAVELLSHRKALGMEGAHLRSLTEGIHCHAGNQLADLSFARSAATFPWYSQAVWYLGQMIRWGDYAEVLDFKKTAQTVYRPSLYREAARDLGLAYPSIGYKNEGIHESDWELEEASEPLPMGSDLFFDDRPYNPHQTMKYLNAQSISHIRAPLDALWAIR